MTTRTIYASNTHLIATIDDLFVAAFVGEPSEAAARAQEAGLAAFVAHVPAPRSYVQLARLTSSTASSGSLDAMRRTYARIARAHKTDFVTAALVLYEDGFGAALVRGVLTGVGMMVQGHVKVRAFDALPSALAWSDGERRARQLSPIGVGVAREIQRVLTRARHELA